MIPEFQPTYWKPRGQTAVRRAPLSKEETQLRLLSIGFSYDSSLSLSFRLKLSYKC